MTAGMGEGNGNRSARRRLGRLALAVGSAFALTLLAGCSGSETSLSGETWLRDKVLFGTSKEEQERIAAEARAKAANIPATVDYDSLPCPQAIVRDSATHYTIYARDEIPDAKAIRYQGTLNRVSRECKFGPDGFTMKHGFAGRVLLGPKGSPGSVTLPVRVDLVGTREHIVWSKVYKIEAVIGPGQTSVPFVHVADDIAYQPKQGEFLRDFRVNVGFDVTEQR
jgi:hypothetical protein